MTTGYLPSARGCNPLTFAGVIRGLVLCGGDAVFLHQILDTLEASMRATSGRGGDACSASASTMPQCKGRPAPPQHNRTFPSTAQAHHGIHISGLDVAWRHWLMPPLQCAPDLAAVGALSVRPMMACSRPPPPTAKFFRLSFARFDLPAYVHPLKGFPLWEAVCNRLMSSFRTPHPALGTAFLPALSLRDISPQPGESLNPGRLLLMLLYERKISDGTMRAAGSHGDAITCCRCR